MYNVIKLLLTSKVLPKRYTRLLIPFSKEYNLLIKRNCSLSYYDINLKVNKVSLDKYIQHLQNEYKQLKATIVAHPEKNQRLQELQAVVDILHTRDLLINNILNLKDLLIDKDTEIQELAVQEKAEFEEKIRLLDKELLEALLPQEKEDARNDILLEVNAGVGGQEAMLFAKELFNMYCSFAAYKRWDVTVAEYLSTDLGGIRHASLLINGNRVFQYFKHEAGVHRVQRIPATEKHGRVHTSTVSVIALPQPTDIEIKINPKDLKIETKRASGAGGQHVNTTDSAVRIIHLPTGLSVESQVDRSQSKNRTIALKRLRALLYEQQLQVQQNMIESTKKSQVRSNLRSEKIRTYNFSQDRITDHRLQGSNIHNLKVFLEGGKQLEDLMEKLQRANRIDALLALVNNFNNKK